MRIVHSLLDIFLRVEYTVANKRKNVLRSYNSIVIDGWMNGWMSEWVKQWEHNGVKDEEKGGGKECCFLWAH